MVKIVTFFKLKPGNITSIVANLKKIPEIVKIQTVTGEYDLLVEFEVSDPDEIYNIFSQKIDILPGLIDTNSHYVVALWEK